MLERIQKGFQPFVCSPKLTYGTTAFQYPQSIRDFPVSNNSNITFTLSFSRLIGSFANQKSKVGLWF